MRLSLSRRRDFMIMAVAGAFVFGPAPKARAAVSELWNYVKQYQLGIDYTNSSDGVDANYATAKTAAPPMTCKAEVNDPTLQRCSVHMSSGRSSGFGLFLQQAFKRQGIFYFNADIGFGARYLTGGMDTKVAEEQVAAGLPLKKMSFSLAALVVKPYVTLGLTPIKWPDLLLSLGPAAQVAVGDVRVDEERKHVAMATTSSGLIGGFFELEIVFWRFGAGALSAFTSNDVTGDGRGSKFFPKDVDGMHDIRADFSHGVGGGLFGMLGAKLVLDWP